MSKDKAKRDATRKWFMVACKDHIRRVYEAIDKHGGRINDKQYDEHFTPYLYLPMESTKPEHKVNPPLCMVANTVAEIGLMWWANEAPLILTLKDGNQWWIALAQFMVEYKLLKRRIMKNKTVWYWKGKSE